MKVVKPKALKVGDTVGIISPSAGLPSIFPAVYENGLKIFEEFGLKVKELPTVDFIIYQLRSMGVQGIFKHLTGLIIGRARDYSDKQKQELETRVLEQVRQEFKRPDLPVIANFDTGHSDPQVILPLNCAVTINCDERTIRLTESPTI